MRSRSLALLGILVASTAAAAGAPAPPPPRKAPPPPPPTSTVLFVKQAALWSLTVDGPEGNKAQPAQVAPLPTDLGAVRALSVSTHGEIVVVHGTTASAWMTDGKTWNRCAGRAMASPRGEAVLCVAGAQITLTPVGEVKLAAPSLPGPLKDVSFRASAAHYAFLTDDGVFGLALAAPKKKQRLTKAGPVAELLVAPDGTQAVAVIGEGAKARIHGFALDGDGTPRRLGGPGVPVSWSWDSLWVLLEEGASAGHEHEDEGASLTAEPVLLASLGDAGELVAAGKAKGKPAKGKGKGAKAAPKAPEPIRVRTCVVRATGGESKCWNQWSPRAFAPPGNGLPGNVDTERVLLFKEGTLAVGKIPGVRPEPPRKLLEGVDGPAAWFAPPAPAVR
jgi:hypothetical protein